MAQRRLSACPRNWRASNAFLKYKTVSDPYIFFFLTTRGELYYGAIRSECVFVFKKIFHFKRHVLKAQCHTRERGLNTPVSNTLTSHKKWKSSYVAVLLELR